MADSNPLLLVFNKDKKHSQILGICFQYIFHWNGGGYANIYIYNLLMVKDEQKENIIMDYLFRSECYFDDYVYWK